MVTRRRAAALLCSMLLAACGGTEGDSPTPNSGGSSGSSGGSVDGAALYASRCANCHLALGSSAKRGATAAQIEGRHGDLVTAGEAAAIAAVLH